MSKIAPRLLLLASLVSHPTHEARSQETVSEIVQASLPAVVQITVETAQGVASGSGFIVDPKGLVVTNYHVIRDAEAALISLPSGDVYDNVRLVVRDERHDIAVLRISGFGLPALVLGDSDSVTIGAAVVAIGSPFGLENTVSTGIVSGRREIEGSRILQISAPISAGSSGGPILNNRGEVIGLAVSQLTQGQNLNFAVPINYVRGLLLSSADTPDSELRPLSDLESMGIDTMDRWLVAADSDLVTLTPIVELRLEASSFRGTEKAPTLVIRCAHGESSVRIAWYEYVDQKAVDVTTRMGEKKPLTAKWNVSDDYSVILLWGGSVKASLFVDQLMLVDRFAARVERDHGHQQTAAFHLTGLKSAIVPFREVCPRR